MDWTGITVDTSDVLSAMAMIVPGLFVVGGLHKVIKIANRS
jgi:hypothetical protein